jgi:solute carrier family 25 carnitine/acylcarnitine transporter 20/29
MQTMAKPAPGQAPMFSGMWDCAVKTVRHEGVREISVCVLVCLTTSTPLLQFGGLYKGMGSPLVGVPPMYAVVFWSYGMCSRLLETPGQVGPLSIWQTMLAGAGSGVFTTVRSDPRVASCRLRIVRSGRR